MLFLFVKKEVTESPWKAVLFYFTDFAIVIRMENPNTIYIFTDGSSLGNPGAGGFGAIVVDGETVKELGGGEKHTTNNRMELSAAIAALAHLGETEKKIILRTDSSYVINGITKWVFGWKKNNWITSQKQEVMNRDLWEKLSSFTFGKKIQWEYVGGHIGVSGNERADAIAVSFAEGSPAALFDGNLSEYPIRDILNISHDVGMKESRSKSREHSKAKAYSYVSLVDGKIEKHSTWAECEARVKGKKAKYKKAVSKEDEDEIIRGWGF